MDGIAGSETNIQGMTKLLPYAKVAGKAAQGIIRI